MPENYHDIQLPRVARQIMRISKPHRDDQSGATAGLADVPKHTIGLLRPFSGLLKTHPSPERRRFFDLSYLTLLPPVVREFAEPTREVTHRSTETAVERDRVATTLERTVVERVSTPPLVTRTVRGPMFTERTGTEHARRQPTTVTNRIDRVEYVDRTSPDGSTAPMDTRAASTPSLAPSVNRRAQNRSIRTEILQFTVATWPARILDHERTTGRRPTSEFEARLATRRTVPLVTADHARRTVSEPTIGFQRHTNEHPTQLPQDVSTQFRHRINEQLPRDLLVRSDRHISLRQTEADVRERRGVPQLANDRLEHELVRTAPTIVVSPPLRSVETTEPRHEGIESSPSPSAGEPPDLRVREVLREAANSQGVLTTPTRIVSRLPRTVEAVETRHDRTRSLTVARKTALTVTTEGTVERRRSGMNEGGRSDTNEHIRSGTPAKRSTRLATLDATAQRSYGTTEAVSPTPIERLFEDPLDLVHKREQPVPDSSERIDPERAHGHGHHAEKRVNETKLHNSSEKHISTLESIANRHMEGDPTIDRLVDHLFTRFERKLRIERERRGR